MGEDPFAGWAERYDAWYDTEGRQAFEIELRALKAVAADLPAPWVEVGVGTGRFARALGIPTGVDPSPELLGIAQSRGIQTVCGRAENLPFHDRTFGTVFLITTWEFLTEPFQALREIRRVLKPGGALVNAYLDREGKWAKSYIEKARAGHQLFKYARFYGYEEVVDLTRKAGFQIIRTLSALFHGPGEQGRLEEPLEGYHPGASFVVLLAERE